jgi:RimJ/RimL family protein N-acetyltransferase
MVQERLVLRSRVLQGRFVTLEPYDERLKEDLRRALDCDDDAWSVFASSGQGEHFESWWETSVREMSEGRRVSFAIRTLADSKIVGTSSLLNIRPTRGSVEIGATFLHPIVRSGPVNPESKALLFDESFSSGALRVELLTDVRNVRSQAAIAKLGAVREGILRRDRVTWTGHVRDSVIYSVTDLDWEQVRRGLEGRLSAFEGGSLGLASVDPF